MLIFPFKLSHRLKFVYRKSILQKTKIKCENTCCKKNKRDIQQIAIITRI